jgi:hypothetical protein
MEDLEAIEAVAQFLEDNVRPFTPKEIYKAIQRKGVHVEGDLKAFILEVQERGLAKTMEVIEALRDFLDIPPSRGVLDGVEKWLRDGALLEVRGPQPEVGWSDLEVAIRMDYDGYTDTIRRERFSGPRHHLFSWVLFGAKAGLETLHVSPVYGARGKVALEASSPDYLETVLERLRGLRPLLSAMELSDLEGAIERLSELEKGESRIEGPYLLVQGKNYWGGDVWALRRGPIFGDPELDGALLTKRKATLRFPGDVEFSFQVWWNLDTMAFKCLRIRWGDEEVNFRYPHSAFAHPLAKNPVTEAIQSSLVAEIPKLESHGRSDQFHDSLSFKMLALLKAFSKHEDPFGALAEGRLFAHAKAEFFIDF